jgi:NAD+ synthetase
MIQDYGKAVEKIRENSKQYFSENNIKAVVIGMSGGIDSALCAALLEPVCKELKIPLIGRSLPITTNKPDELERARLCGEVFCTDFKEIDLGPCFEDMERHLASTEGIMPIADAHAQAIARGNRKARLRMIRLYDLAGTNKGLVISTDNYTELCESFFTLHGDVGDFCPIQMLWKTEVYKMSEYLIDAWKEELETMTYEVAHKNIPFKIRVLQSCVEAIPTDGLGITNSDLDQIMPNWQDSYKDTREAYEAVDQILIAHAPVDHPVMKRHIASEFKRKIPIIIPRLIFTDDDHAVS